MNYKNRLIARIEDSFNELIVTHIEYCEAGCDVQDNLCDIGKQLVQLQNDTMNKLTTLQDKV